MTWETINYDWVASSSILEISSYAQLFTTSSAFKESTI